MEETSDNSDCSQCMEDGSLALMAIQDLHTNGDTPPRGTLESPPLATSTSRTDSVISWKSEFWGERGERRFEMLIVGYVEYFEDSGIVQSPGSLLASVTTCNKG